MFKIASAVLLLATSAAFAQAQLVPEVPGFVPSVAAPEAGLSAPAAAASRRGVWTTTVNIEISSTIPTNNKLTCSVNLGHSGSGASYSETASIYATRKGNKARCVVVIPYLWPKANTDGYVTLSLQVGTTISNEYVVNGFYRAHGRYETDNGPAGAERRDQGHPRSPSLTDAPRPAVRSTAVGARIPRGSEPATPGGADCPLRPARRAAATGGAAACPNHGSGGPPW